MAFSTKIKGNHDLQGNVQVYNVRIPVSPDGFEGLLSLLEILYFFLPGVLTKWKSLERCKAGVGGSCRFSWGTPWFETAESIWAVVAFFGGTLMVLEGTAMKTVALKKDAPVPLSDDSSKKAVGRVGQLAEDV